MTREKKARMAMHSGRDNRTPFVGGTQFPTSQSKSHANKLLSQSKGRAEVGPAPSVSKMDKSGLSTNYGQTVKMPSAVGSLPKIGSDMTHVKDPFLTWTEKNAKQLETNLPSLQTQVIEEPKQAEPPGPSNSLIEMAKKRDDELLREMFTRYPVDKSVL